VEYLEAWERDVTAIDDESLSDVALDGVQTAFRTVQAFEAWSAHGAWVAAHPGALGADVAARFEWASAITPGQAAAARAALERARCALDAALGDAVLVLPSAASVAPALDAAGEEIEAVRAATLRMTTVAGATGRPALSVPGLTVGGAPVGVCFVGPRGSDLALVRAAADWVPAAKRH
jgi:Asp-tRNA(Asn)/Glu-tRNA(Gln) amidotransferase A subunit family amidase